jgi:DNA-binding NarL/FixJ family response regulator
MGLKHKLETAGMTVVGEIENGEDTCKQVRHLQPDILVLASDMPNSNTIEVVQTLRQNTAIIILSKLNDEATVLVMLKAGAKGVVIEGERCETLVAAVEAILLRQVFLSPRLLECQGDWAMTNLPDKYKLSQREQKILRLIALGKENPEIADELHLAKQTVKNISCSIRKKLGLKSRVLVAYWAIQAGIVSWDEVLEQLAPNKLF